MYFTEEHEAFRVSFKDFLQKEVVKDNLKR